MIKSRVSLAQVTSLGRSSAYVMDYVFVRVQVLRCVDMMCVYCMLMRDCNKYVGTDSSVLLVRVADI
jgi:hypothetical protein